MKKKEKMINAYLLRVDPKYSTCYQGYSKGVENALSFEQKFVGGLIQVISINENIDCICNDEGKLLELPYNRVWLDDDGTVLDVLCGNLMCVRHDEEGNFTSILPEDIEVIEKHLIPFCGMVGKRILTTPFMSLPVYDDKEGEDGN